jgi:hypothetical protein
MGSRPSCCALALDCSPANPAVHPPVAAAGCLTTRPTLSGSKLITQHPQAPSQLMLWLLALVQWLPASVHQPTSSSLSPVLSQLLNGVLLTLELLLLACRPAINNISRMPQLNNPTSTIHQLLTGHDCLQYGLWICPACQPGLQLKPHLALASSLMLR